MKKLLLMAALGASGPTLLGITHYTQSVNSVTSVTIENSSHGIGSADIGVRVYNSAGARQPSSSYTVSINQSTYAVTVGWGSSFTGTVKLSGPLGAPDSSNSTDFKPELDRADSNDPDTMLWVCKFCNESSGLAKRTVNGNRYVMWNSALYTHSTGSCTLRAYVQDSTVVFALSGSSGACNGSCTVGTNCRVEYSISDFPSGVLKVATATANSTPSLSNLVDERPF